MNLDNLHLTLLDLVSLITSPQPDELLLRDAAVTLDRALFPLLLRIGTVGPIGVGDLANSVGRDYSTVSRQVQKLHQLGLVIRAPSPVDQRVNLASITPEGAGKVNAIQAARKRIYEQALAEWPDQERADLARLTRKLVDGLLDVLAERAVAHQTDSQEPLG